MSGSKIAIGGAIAIAISLGVVELLHMVESPKFNPSQRDKIAIYYDLGALAREMIDKGGPDIADSDHGKFITSYTAFYDYVAKQRPDAVANVNAPNPFPGILPERSYARPSGKLTDGYQSLISSVAYPSGSGSGSTT